MGRSKNPWPHVDFGRAPCPGGSPRVELRLSRRKWFPPAKAVICGVCGVELGRGLAASVVERRLPDAPDPRRTKRCGSCRRTFPATLEHFGAAQSMPYGLYCYCRRCINTKMAIWRATPAAARAARSGHALGPASGGSRTAHAGARARVPPASAARSMAAGTSTERRGSATTTASATGG